MKGILVTRCTLSAGHSQGTTTLLAALASQPELQERVSVAVLLAAVRSDTHTKVQTCPLHRRQLRRHSMDASRSHYRGWHSHVLKEVDVSLICR